MHKFSQKAHIFAPKLWRKTPNITGDYDFDSSICHCKNSEGQSKVEMHTAYGNAYHPITGYHGYNNYSGDD
jgi:hypothetical protein